MATAGPNRYVDLGVANAGIVRVGPGTVFSASCVNTNAAVRYLLLCDKATTPVNTDVPVDVIAIPASGGMGTHGSNYFSDSGLRFTLGIAWAFSTTPNVVTLGTAGEQTTRINYA